MRLLYPVAGRAGFAILLDSTERAILAAMPNKLTHAGCVVFRNETGRTLFLTITSSNRTHWVLPQGHIEAGENAEAAALRELQEEAGVEVEIFSKLSVREYDKVYEHVVIQYFLVCALVFTTTTEGRTLRWEEEEGALKMLTFEAAKTALREGADTLRRTE